MKFATVPFALLGLFFVLGEAADLSLNCDVGVTLSYNDDDSVLPGVTCTPKCAALENGWYKQRVYFRDELLAIKHKKMVEININVNGDSDCRLVPTADDFLDSNGQDSVWIGLNDKDVESTYVWRDGSEYGHFTNWADGEPNNKGYYDEEDCVELLAGSYKWNDQGCQAHKKFLCEAATPEEIAPPPQKLCPEGWAMSPTTNKCYSVTTQLLTWDESQSFCNDVGGSLTSIHSKEEFWFIKDQVREQDFDGNVWVGMKDAANNDKFVWADATPSDYTKWSSGEPSSIGSWYYRNENCVELRKNKYYDWNDADCTLKQRAVCSREPDVLPRKQCPDGWTADNYDTCYKLVESLKTFDDAETMCELMTYGGSLVSPINDFQNDFVNEKYGSQNIWVGLKEGPTEGSYLTADGETQSFFSWGPNEANRRDAGVCVEMSFLGDWYKQECSNKYAFVCAIPQSQNPPTA